MKGVKIRREIETSKQEVKKRIKSQEKRHTENKMKEEEN